MRSCESLTTIVIVLLLSVVKSVREVPAPYCAAKYPSGRCCSGRQDECNVLIKGTLCYCDNFCDETSHDCCPDFWSHCRGMENATTTSAPEEIRRCYVQGKYYNINETWKDNCNECKCIPMGRNVTKNCGKERCLVDDPNNVFWGRKLEEAEYFLGSYDPSEMLKRMKPIRRVYDPNTLPREFDARKRWPGYISGIVNQYDCGACWAISVASVASDRFAIMSKGVERVDLSAQHLLSCNTKHQHGCEGGKPERAWRFIEEFGLVDEACYPFTTADGKNEECRMQIKKNTTLKEAGCAPPPNPRRRELYKVGPAYRLGSVTDIMCEILMFGPVQALMTEVYPDLMKYTLGVYRHKRSPENKKCRSKHSVRIIGWGEEASRKFWLVMNSWGERWGEQGLFKIDRDTNECGIESFVLAANPKTI